MALHFTMDEFAAREARLLEAMKAKEARRDALVRSGIDVLAHRL
jgi:hypothetical protein